MEAYAGIALQSSNSYILRLRAFVVEIALRWRLQMCGKLPASNVGAWMPLPQDEEKSWVAGEVRISLLDYFVNSLA